MRSCRPLLLAAFSLTTGCLGQIIPEHTPMEEPELHAMLAQSSFEGATFAKLNAKPFASTLKAGAWVTMFVSRDAAAAYDAVSPDGSGPTPPPFPVGGIAVRAISDASGARTGLTVMVKREPGYFPEAGDFFFAVTDLAGAPVEGVDGTEWGRLKSCGDCHRTRASQGYLFGMPHAME